MGIAKMVRSGIEPYTAYVEAHTPHGVLDGYDKDATVSPMTGKVTPWAWLGYCLDASDAESENATGMIIEVPIPAGAWVQGCEVRIEEAFAGTGTDDVDCGDAANADGYLDGADLSQAAGTVLRDVDAAYVSGTSDTPGKFYANGDHLKVRVGSADDLTAGKATIWFLMKTYFERLEAEG